MCVLHGVCCCLEQLKTNITIVLENRRLNFDDFSLTDEDYSAWTGWTKEQFDHLHDCISHHLRSSSHRSTRNE